MQQFEIEIKSLLGDKENADSLRDKLLALNPPAQLKRQNSQLNHYFQGPPASRSDREAFRAGGNMARLEEKILPHIPEGRQEALKRILEKGENHSVRTRQMNNQVLFVVKASIDDTTSSNGIARMEFEEVVPLTLAELDQLLLDAGLDYQAKWSRDREEYTLRDITVCLDRNAGYGYLAEFEKIVSEGAQSGAVKAELLALMKQLGIEELPQDRLERMFAYYNAHWKEYYGTEKIFVIE